MIGISFVKLVFSNLLLPAISAYLQSITPVDELGTFTATCLASMAGVTHIAIIPFDEITIISATALANIMG